MVQLRELTPPIILPPGYDMNAQCEFHLRAPDHAIENCKDLKYKVQYLIDSKDISFMPNGPSVNNNPMPLQANPLVSMVEGFQGRNMMIVWIK